MTDLWQGALVDCGIWHARSGDIDRSFRYRATYLALPLEALENDALPIKADRAGIWSFRRKDHGARDGSSLAAFFRNALAEVGLAHTETTLIALPRTIGYGFNPVSFWLARDETGLRAVLAEVSNTFGEHHFYLCRHPDNQPILPTDRISGEKVFHVSPFLPRRGRYVFRFDAGAGRFGAWVDWLDDEGNLKLQTSMAGPARDLTRSALRRAMVRGAFQTHKVMALIHWQAARLFSRGARFYKKPDQLPRTRSEATEG